MAVGRPPTDDSQAEFAKFGLALRGDGESKPLAAYVRRELLRRGMKWALPPGDDELFIDCMAFLNLDGACSEREICDLVCLETYDPEITKHMVSTNVISGLLIQTAHESPRDCVIHLPGAPQVTDAHSNAVYECNSGAFVLTCATLVELPTSLNDLVEGLFDGVPIPRDALSSRSLSRRTNVIITSTKAAETTTIQRMHVPRHKQRGNLNTIAATLRPVKKHARFSPFVQVKYIPRVLKIWSCDSDSHSPSLKELRELFCKVDMVRRENMYAESQLEPESVTSELVLIVDTVFGRPLAPFIGVGSENIRVSHFQKFLLLQGVLILNRLPNCYGPLRELCIQHAPAGEESPPLVSDSVIADMANHMFRVAVFIGMVVEIVAGCVSFASEELETRFPSATAFTDAGILLNGIEASPKPNCLSELKTRKLALILDGIYRDMDPIDVALQESVGLNTAELLSAAIDISVMSAFEHSGWCSGYMEHFVSLLDARLREGGCLAIFR